MTPFTISYFAAFKKFYIFSTEVIITELAIIKIRLFNTGVFQAVSTMVHLLDYNISFLSIHELWELSKPNHFTNTVALSPQYLLYQINIVVFCFSQFGFVKRTFQILISVVFQTVSYGVRMHDFAISKYLVREIRRVAFLKYPFVFRYSNFITDLIFGWYDLPL